jgi:histidyl-tRNA synthetase
MGKIVPRNYRGTRDWLGGEASLRQQVINIFREVFEEFGFEPLETPEIELYEVLMGKYGEEAQPLIYYFQRGDDWIGLRYDHTVPLARVVAQYANKLVFPYRRYAIGPVFRGEEPQAGRYRRFIQCDFDIVGVADPIADAEVITVTYTALKRLGFQNFEIQLNDRRLLNGIAKASGAYTKDLILTFLRSWDKMEKVSRGQITQELKEKGASPELIGRFFEITDQLLSLEKENILDELGRLFPNQPEVAKGIDVLQKLLEYIADFGVPPQFYRVNPCLARGLDYYTGPIFETVIKEAKIGSITGGGRYDNLIEELGGPSLPATGSSFGLERIISVMEKLGIAKIKKTSTQVFVAIFDPESAESIKKAIQFASVLRQEGINTELSMEKGSIGKQIRVADRRGIPIVIFAGPKEMKKGKVIVKDLTIPFPKEKEDIWANQWEVSEEEFVKKVKELLKSKRILD